MPLPEFAENNLFGPLGITNYCWRFSKKGRAIGMGSFHMRPRDMMKIGQLFLDKGTWKGQQIVSEAWVNQATQPLVAAVPPNTKTDGSQAMGYSMGYGFQWFTYTPRSFEDPRVAYYFASGNGGQRIYVFPKLDMVVVFTGGHYNRGKAHKQTIEILNRSILYSAL
jgi:CubicO group peptidase (beta-lactamase class C family)